MAEHNTYSHTDIKRYLQQQMTLNEMHAFERMMMDDPFLADAIEGYSKADNEAGDKHLQQIKKAIRGEKEDALVVPITKSRSTVWKSVAAAVAAVIIGGVAFLLFTKDVQHTEPATIAKQETSGTPSVADSTTGLTNESPAVTERVAKRNAASYKNNSVASSPLTTQVDSINISEEVINNNGSLATADIATRDEQVKAEKEVSKDVQAGNTLASFKKRADSSAAATEAKAEERVAASSLRKEETRQNLLQGVARRNANEFRGRVVDNRGEPLPFASVRSNNNAIETMADGEGNFILNAPDTVVSVTVNSVGHEVALAQLNSSAASNNIVLNDSKISLDEVIVVGYGQKRRKEITAANSVAKADTAARPQGGWDKFNQYVKTQIDSFKITLNENDDRLNEDVYLEFNVDKQGRPINITVSPETKKQSAEKVVEVLQNGPRWQRLKKNRKVKLKIPF